MKYLFICILLFSLTNANSQNDENYYEIIYKSSSMTRNSYKQPKEAYMSLHVNGNKSIYQWETERKLDSIRSNRETTLEDLNRYFSVERYAIEINNNKLKFYDVISDIEYQYEENLNFKWKLKPETKIIKGYKCNKATVNYGGRDWEAWYTLTLPIDAGPYKFKGLPGLIIKITDSTNSYNFELISIKQKDCLLMTKAFHHSKENKRVNIDRNKYNKLRFAYNSLGYKARMDLLNKKNDGSMVLEFTNTDGSNPFAGDRNIDRSKNNNYIEIDHD